MTLTLRPYQANAVTALFDYFEIAAGCPLVVAPTGSGKSVILSAFIHRACSLYPGTRILVATHVKELVEQDAAALRKVWPSADLGINSASVGRRDTRQPVLFASIQSIYRAAFDFEPFDLFIVDEAHLVPKKSEGMYRRLIHDLKLLNSALKVIGFTATPYRLGSGLLTEGKDRIFDDIAYEITIPQLVKAGHLAPLTTRGGERKVNLEGLHVRQGEYITKELLEALAKDNITETALQEVIDRGENRKSWLVFCVDVAHAEQARDILRSKGVSAEAVSGKTPKRERERIVQEFKAGRIRALTNCAVFTTGFDAPGVDLLAMLRPTKSAGLYVQMLGRGMRIAPGKTDCLVLDFARNIETHGPVDTIRVRKRPVEQGGQFEAKGLPCRECPGCHLFVPIQQWTCAECGCEFPRDLGHEETATEAAVMSEPVEKRVWRVRYSIWKKKGKPDSLRVDYVGGLMRICSEWVCVAHGGGARLKAAKWWAERVGGRAPATAEEALEQVQGAREPLRILIDESGRWPRLLEVVEWKREEERAS